MEDEPDNPIDEVPAEPIDPVLAVKGEYEAVLTAEQLAAWVQRLRAADLIAFDTETDSLDPMRAQIVGISLATAVGEAAYIPLRHDYAGAPDQLATAAVLERMRRWLEDPTAAKVGGGTMAPTTLNACIAFWR